MDDYDELKKEVKELAEIAKSVPPALQEKCFEILLTRLLDKNGVRSAPREGAHSEAHVQPEVGGGGELKLPSQVRVFMQRTGITQEQLKAVVTREDDEIHFLKEPHNISIAKGQIAWALLLALKNGLENNAFAVDPEDVRSICQDKGFYDKANFAAHFKKAANAKLFKGQLDPQGEARALTNEGQNALSALVKDLAGTE